MQSFSVLMSVYRNDKPEFVHLAIESIITEQIRKPDEIVLVVDGPVSNDLADLLIGFQNIYSRIFNIIWLPENKGLGNALRIGVEAAKNEIIARMDSDDISSPDRFEKQIAFMESNPQCIVLGGQISEFIGDECNIVGVRKVPTTNEGIHSWLKSRCPFNHMSVALRRSSVLSVDNYIDWHFNEDYFLWIRMAEAGCIFANLPDTLVNVRVGKDMYARRGGWKYFKSEKGLQDYMLKKRMISLPRYGYNVLGRFLVQVMMPNKIRGFIFRKFFRTN